MCNDNMVAFTPIAGVNDIRFRTGVSVEPSGWDDPIPANQCRTYELNETIDLCKDNRVIDIEMEGILDKSRPNYCRCYLYKDALSVITADM